eukprot:g24451.t1
MGATARRRQQSAVTWLSVDSWCVKYPQDRAGRGRAEGQRPNRQLDAAWGHHGGWEAGGRDGKGPWRVHGQREAFLGCLADYNLHHTGG